MDVERAKSNLISRFFFYLSNWGLVPYTKMWKQGKKD